MPNGTCSCVSASCCNSHVVTALSVPHTGASTGSRRRSGPWRVVSPEPSSGTAEAGVSRRARYRSERCRRWKATTPPRNRSWSRRSRAGKPSYPWVRPSYVTPTETAAMWNMPFTIPAGTRRLPGRARCSSPLCAGCADRFRCDGCRDRTCRRDGNGPGHSLGREVGSPGVRRRRRGRRRWVATSSQDESQLLRRTLEEIHHERESSLGCEI